MYSLRKGVPGGANIILADLYKAKVLSRALLNQACPAMSKDCPSVPRCVLMLQPLVGPCSTSLPYLSKIVLGCHQNNRSVTSRRWLLSYQRSGMVYH